ncbi:hypothetical protein CDAR_217531 [Caerostris darwini]|uniref:Uncharacterized protein n=1 Tax=Caerostris darwini TaxID=1538125 RepID=A0AAV4WTG3_9ARAC|nr:hypothetical protein CDAR_217531 [Caerostris darwini]
MKVELEDQGLESAQSPDLIHLVHLWNYVGRRGAALRCFRNHVSVPLRCCDSCLKSGRGPCQFIKLYIDTKWKCIHLMNLNDRPCRASLVDECLEDQTAFIALP